MSKRKFRFDALKSITKSYGSFTKSERTGLLAVCLLLLVLVCCQWLIRNFAHPTGETVDGKLTAAWETFKRGQPRPPKDTEGVVKNDFHDAFDDDETPMPQTININTTDSATLVRLKGIGPVTASRIISYRVNNGLYTRTDELVEFHLVRKSVYELLKNHLTVDTSER